MAEIEIFKELIKDLKPLMKTIGFINKGSAFIKRLEDNFGVINFQKSRDRNAEFLKFTLNFGVYSDILGKFEYYESKINPGIIDCQWQARMGKFMDGKPDYWWKIYKSDNTDDLITQVHNQITDVVLPEINKRSSINGLINCWLNENQYGTTEIGMFKYVTTLLKVNGDMNRYNKEVAHFLESSKGTPAYHLANEHLKKLKIWIKVQYRFNSPLSSAMASLSDCKLPK